MEKLVFGKSWFFGKLSLRKFQVFGKFGVFGNKIFEFLENSEVLENIEFLEQQHKVNIQAHKFVLVAASPWCHIYHKGKDLPSFRQPK